MPAESGSATAARRDLALIAVITAAAVFVAVHFELSETLFRLTRGGESLQIDEIPGVLLVVAACLAWYAARRYAEARRELQRGRELDRRLAQALSENRRLAQQYVEVQEVERRALARDLHDELGQYLNAIKIDAVGLRERSGTDGAARSVAEAMIANIDTVQQSVIGLIRQLRPVGLDEFGLAGALEHCVGEWRRRLPNATLELSVGDDLDQLEEVQRLTLYRLVQEALTNIARHARASRVIIDVHIEQQPATGERAILARIEDDGHGVTEVSASSGLGLVGMRERVEALGGTLSLTASTGVGFAVRARIPLQGRL